MLIDNKTVTLVDQIENQLLTYFKNNKFRIGDEIPNENRTYNALGVSRSAWREALEPVEDDGTDRIAPQGNGDQRTLAAGRNEENHRPAGYSVKTLPRPARFPAYRWKRNKRIYLRQYH